MKKISLVLNFLLAMLLSCSVFAAQHYSASLNPVPANEALGKLPKLTQVFVINNSKNEIYAIDAESNGKVNLEIPPGKQGMIRLGDLFKDWIHLTLQDSNQTMFFAGTFVGKRNTLIVSGETGSHSVEYSDKEPY